MPADIAPFHQQAEDVGRFLIDARARERDAHRPERPERPSGPSENAD
jgi:hypothetical protein